MMFNFIRIYEALFKSFNVSADTELVSLLEADWIKNLMIIKRSWIFGLFKSWIFLLIILVMCLNVFLIYLNFEGSTESWILIWILVFAILYWFLSVFIYFRKFKHIYWERAIICDTASKKQQLMTWDEAFKKFFNQTIFNYFVVLWITAYIAYYIIFIAWFMKAWIYGFLNIFFLLAQIFLSIKFKKRMLDLEMDFAIVIPGKIMFYNQSNLQRSEATINSEKIKTITSEYAWLFWSMLNYWDVTVMTEWDEANVWEMKLHYIPFPTETVYEINELLWTNKAHEQK
jgi:hypothetical protein